MHVFVAAVLLSGLCMPTFVLATQGINPCHKQCARLLTGVKPQAEARRVYTNCRRLCDPPKKAEPAKKKDKPDPRPEKQRQKVCVWVGTAPLCKGRCPPRTFEDARSDRGDGDLCVTGSKALCCQWVVVR
jgi:hypothetical protein